MANYAKPIFVCPTCGERENEDIAFVCNTCDVKDTKHIDGIYYCPECETHMHPFQCRICDSLEVAYMSPLVNNITEGQISLDPLEEDPSLTEE